MNDLRYALRMLLKNPGFSAVAILVLALGIGANSAIFTVVNTVLLRPLPYPEPDRIVQIMRRFPFGYAEAISAAKFVFWKEQNQVFEHIAAFDVLGAGYNVTSGNEPERLSGIRVSADFFRVLGVRPELGRDFTKEDDLSGGERTVIISDGLWKRRFGGERGIIGKAISLSGESYAVVGVMPADFQSRPVADLWTPLRPVFNAQDQANLLVVLGRMKRGATLEKAQANMEKITEDFRRAYPKQVGDDEKVAVASYHERLIGDVRPALLVLVSAVCFLLLIACANVANLLLARATARSKEIAIRAALGAGRSRLIWQLLTESALLAIGGAALGLLLARWSLRGLVALTPGNLPRFGDITIDGRVLAFTFLVALATGLLFGLAPALQMVKIDLNDSLREAGSRATVGWRRGRLRNLLVVGEIALSLVLLVGAALLIQTFSNLRKVDPGFDPKNVLTMKMSLTGTKYNTTADLGAFFQRLLEQIETLPGVEAAAYVTSLPLEPGVDLPFDIEGRPENNSSGAQWRSITPHYFNTMRIPLRHGRQFREQDSGGSPGVVIINEAFARQFFPKNNPLGERLTIGKSMGPDFADRTREIVGIVGDVKEQSLNETAPATMFLPLAQVPDSITEFGNRILPASWVVRTKGDPLGLSTTVRQRILAVDRAQPVSSVESMARVLAASIAQQQFNTLLLGIFAAVALLLAAVGIYGVMAYSVAQRTSEIGIRMALGAQTADVLKLVLRQGMMLTSIGVLIGIGAALGLTQLMSTLLFQVGARDPVTFLGISLVLGAVALLACYVPGRKAMRVDPIVALRYE